MSEQPGLVQRLRNGGQNDLADDAERLFNSLNQVTCLLDFAIPSMRTVHARVVSKKAVSDALTAIAYAKGYQDYQACVLAEHNSMQEKGPK